MSMATFFARKNLKKLLGWKITTRIVLAAVRGTLYTASLWSLGFN